ncbi:hypothetical protein IAI10_22200 [Clostridium sp. 19966]|uniref:alginate O-acetyltransferase AlgX-related protein n=1 Tax=Clostridium sp. 19966 TaxID=2768166 RepID=UPI0028DEF7CF|nr:hypothetical protein [Clostridium sp. 19966]MDT8719369.1 hypothetical protein [Clostridium sp. 19966]
MDSEPIRINEKVTRKRKNKNIYSIIFILAFIAMIFTPITLRFFNSNWRTNMKNAMEANINKLLNIGNVIETQFNNNFFISDKLIEANAAFKYFIFNTSTNSKVLAGKDGWFFLAKSESDNLVDDFKGKNIFTKDELELIKANLLKFNDIAKKRDINFSLVIVPSKYSVYKEFLPQDVIDGSSKNRLSQVKEYMSKNTDIKMIDLTEELSKNEDKGNLYYKTGSLWNQLGAFYGYNQIAKGLNYQDNYYNNVSNYKLNTESKPGMELVQQLKFENLINEQDIRITPKENYSWKQVSSNDDKIIIDSNPKINSGNMLMLKDEFGEALQPYLSENFNKAFYKKEYVTEEDFLVKNNIKNMIFEISENNLESLLSANITEMSKPSAAENTNKVLQKPTVISKSMIDPNTVVIIGGGSDDSTITASGGKDEVATDVVNGTFMIEVKLIPNQNNTITLKAKDKSGNSSNAATINVLPDANIAIQPLIVGKNNFMFESDDLADITGSNMLTKAQLEQIKNKLESYQTYMSGKVPNSKFILFLVPDKMNIYSEYKPDYVTENNETRMKQVIDYLKNNSTISVVDPTETLNNSKDQGIL